MKTSPRMMSDFFATQRTRAAAVALLSLTLGSPGCSDAMERTGDGGSSGSTEGGTSGSDDAFGCASTAIPSFGDDVMPILGVSCVEGCHEPGGMWPLLDLSSDAYGALVSVPPTQVSDMSLVEPCEPESSYLWHKISGTHEQVGGAGTKQMPLDVLVCNPSNYVGDDCTAAPLEDDEIATIGDWIRNGVAS